MGDSLRTWIFWNHRMSFAFGFTHLRRYVQFLNWQWSGPTFWLLNFVRFPSPLHLLLIFKCRLLLEPGTTTTVFICRRVYSNVCQSLLSVFNTSLNGSRITWLQEGLDVVLSSDRFCSKHWFAVVNSSSLKFAIWLSRQVSLLAMVSSIHLFISSRSK